MNSEESAILKNRLIPIPRKIEFQDGDEYILSDGCSITLHLPPDCTAVADLRQLCHSFWQISPAIAVEPSSEAAGMPADSYRLSVDSRQITVTAPDRGGLFNAFRTLRQLAEVRRGTPVLEGYLLIPVTVEDFPASAFRGIHLCIFPETPLWEIEKWIRLAAYHKFNYAVIECWGIFPFASHPEFGWEEKTASRHDLKNLIHLGKKLGITLIPQLNILGHASMARAKTGKHAVLDLNPSLQPLFEPDGWSWCLTNPATRRILTDLVCELHDFFEQPPYFHIGCDEAENLATCMSCRHRKTADLVRDHILYFHNLLGRKGARLIMWHDMLLRKNDPRWKNYIACGLPEQHLEGLYRDLPRDIIIADWQYGYPVDQASGREPDWPTMKFFKEQNFQVLGCPWTEQRGILGIGRFAESEKLFGLLQTTWHFTHDFNCIRIFYTGACAAWNPGPDFRFPGSEQRLALTHHARQVGWDMKLTRYEQTGWNADQVNAGHVVDDQ